MKKIFRLLFVVIIILSFSACSFEEWKLNSYKSDIPETANSRNHANLANTNSQDEQVRSDDAKILIPGSYNMKMIFYSQSPYGNWDLPYQESCEEASLLLAYYYLSDKRPSMEEFHQDLLAMIEWEKIHFGQYFHTSVKETAEIADLYLGLHNYKIIDDPSVDQIKEAIAQGFPIVAPFSGRDLGNPFFSGTGPFYHMLVIKGYDEEKFITNDVGTRQGENFSYEYETIFSAMHDMVPELLLDKANIVKGSKRILVLMPNEEPSASDLDLNLVE